MSNNEFLICKGDGKHVLAIDYDHLCDNPREHISEDTPLTMLHIVCIEHPIYCLPCEKHPYMTYEEMKASDEYFTCPISFFDHTQQGLVVGTSNDWDVRECGYAWCEKMPQDNDNILTIVLMEELNIWNNWANGSCYTAMLYDYNGDLIDYCSGFIADCAEDAYEMQRDYGINFDFNKAHDVNVCWNMHFEDKE